MTPNEFLQMHVTDLQDMKIDYAFLRNSEGYPDTLTGDIDILVKLEDLNQVYRFYKRLNHKNIRLVQIIKKKRDLYVMLFFSQGDERKFLVLEYYTGIVFRGQVVVDGEHLLKNCIVEGVWKRLSEQTSISYTFFHYIIYKGYLPKKYQGDFDKHGLDEKLLSEILTFIDESPTSDEAQKLIETPNILRDRIRQKISKIKMIPHYASQLLRLRPKSLGCALKVNPDDAKAVMEFADKYHLYRPTHRYIIEKGPVSTMITTFTVIVLGGLAVLPRTSVDKREIANTYFEEQMSK